MTRDDHDGRASAPAIIKARIADILLDHFATDGLESGPLEYSKAHIIATKIHHALTLLPVADYYGFYHCEKPVVSVDMISAGTEAFRVWDQEDDISLVTAIYLSMLRVRFQMT